MRTALQPLFREARNAHPGLLIQRGYPLYDDGTEHGRAAKTAHVARICAIPSHSFYQNAYRRWQQATADPLRFRQVELALESRLFIGLTGGGMLETGCAISHSYGSPYIPGSSVKGVVKNQVLASRFGKEEPQVVAELFGADAKPDGAYPLGLSGLVVFHDAWWVPDSAATPLIQEVVTTHHLDYYGQEGAVPASDLDAPIPNAQLAVQGRFLFVLEGPPAWLDLAAQMLSAALSWRGIGAKTRTGYGLFDPQPVEPPRRTCSWVDAAIERLMSKHRAKQEDVLRGKALAEEWAALTDPALKTAALDDIRARWLERNWWGDPQGKAAKQAKAIYEGGA
jgi:CRISPR-associated protein Cmr6